jgi:adenylate cyclase
MLAKWNVLNMVQGWATDVSISGRQARDCARRALDLEPDHALALSMDAAAMAHLGEDLDAARTRCEAAAEADPQEPHAWLTLGALHSYVGDADRAESLAARAIALSPVDPARFLFDMFLAVGRLGAGKYAEAADAAHASIRLNAMHPASYRLLTIALALGGKLDEARISAAEMIRIDPNFRVGTYAQRYAGRDRPHAKLRVQALLMAGVPA